MLTSSEIATLRKAMRCQRPFIFFHDDPDGLASFILLYKVLQRGKGYPLKAAPRLTTDYAHLPKQYGADHVIILDIACADQDFLDQVGLPITWVDHHTLQKPHGVNYLTPRKRNENIPTPALLWPVANKEDLWIATVGCVGDWYIPPFLEETEKKHPGITKGKKGVGSLLYQTPLGLLVHVFSFCLKGATSEVNKNVKILTRIEDPEEILKQTTPRGKFIWKYYSRIKQKYDVLKEKALQQKPNKGLFVFTYGDDTLSLTKDLANELLYLFPTSIIVLGRRKSGEVRCSLRSGPKINVRKRLEKALEHVDGKGGGHDRACGCAIREEDFSLFLDELRKT